jgi:O-antigen/teichoic acid export membrane protein
LNTQRLASALRWNFAFSIATVAIQVVITAIVARLLSPADFGVYAIANIAVVFGRHFGDRGLVSAIVREREIDPETVGTAVVLSVTLSALAAFAVASLAPLAVETAVTVDRNGPFEALLRLMALSILLSGIGAPALALLQRDLRFRDIGALQATGILAGTGAVTIALALAGWGPWSLAVGDLANASTVCGGGWWLMRKRWRLAWRPGRLVRLGIVSVQMTLLRLLDLAWTQLPLVVAGARLATFDVGLYQRSQSLVDLGVNYTTGRFNAVLFPALAERQHRKDLFAELLPPLVGLYALILFPSNAFVVFAAPDIVALLLGGRWADAAGPLGLIMTAFTLLHVSQPASVQLEIRALFAPRFASSILGAAVLGACALPLAGKFGLNGIAAAAIVSAAVIATINFLASVRLLSVPLSQIVSWLLPGLGVAAVIVGALELDDRLFLRHGGWPAARLAALGLAAAAGFVVGVRLLVSPSKRRTLARYLPRDRSRPIGALLRIFGLGSSVP